MLDIFTLSGQGLLTAYTDFMWCSVLCICGQFSSFSQAKFICKHVILYYLVHNNEAEFTFVLPYISPRNLVCSKSNAPKTANGKFLETINISATNFIFFERIAKFK